MTAPVPVLSRFWPKVDKTSTCWIWTASINSKGYGLISVNGRLQLAHRVSYLWAKARSSAVVGGGTGRGSGARSRAG